MEFRADSWNRNRSYRVHSGVVDIKLADNRRR